MAKNYKILILKLVIAVLLVFGAWWLVKCQCINLTAFTPAALRDFIRSFGRLAVLVYIIAYILNTISIMPPIAILSLTAGLAFGSVMGALYLMIGAMIGTSATFVLSRYFGRSLMENILKGRFKDFDEKLAKNGFITILFFRVIPLMPYEVLNYATGLSGIKFKDYFLATLIGLIPGVVIAAFFGGSLGEIKEFKDIFVPKFLTAMALMVLIVTVPGIYRMMRKYFSKPNKPVYFKCEVCGLLYKDKEWALKCREWCARYQSCNLEIIKHAVKIEK